MGTDVVLVAPEGLYAEWEIDLAIRYPLALSEMRWPSVPLGNRSTRALARWGIECRAGWRQVVVIASFAGLALAVVGLSADSLSGRFGLRADDWPSTYSWMTDNAPPGGFRVLWVGDPNVLPADAKVVGDVGFALTRNGVGDARA